MKKSSFVTMVLGTVSGVLFALGMCMALIPEWGAFQPGIIFGCVGLFLALITLIVWRRMTHKEPIRISGKNILTITVGIIGRNCYRSCRYCDFALPHSFHQRY